MRWLMVGLAHHGEMSSGGGHREGTRIMFTKRLVVDASHLAKQCPAGVRNVRPAKR